MAITKRNPSVQTPAARNFFSDFFGNDDFWSFPSVPSLMQQRQNLPAVNIKENDSNYQIEVATPGVPKENVHISVDNNMLTIEGESKYEKEEGTEEGSQYTRREFGFSSFSRSFRLPEGVNPDQIQAQSDNGVLNITIPKTEHGRQQSRKEIKIS